MTFPLASFILFLVTMNIDSFGRWQPHRIICFCYFIIIISFFCLVGFLPFYYGAIRGGGLEVKGGFFKNCLN